MEMKKKKIKMADLKNSKWPPQKKLIFQLRQFSIFFMKFPWIGSWVSRINWCEGHWCSSTYMVVRLSDIRSKTGKTCIFCVLGCFCPYVRQPHNHIGWATSMPFVSINPTNPRTNLWNFGRNCSAFGEVAWVYFIFAVKNTFSKKMAKDLKLFI